MTMPDKRQLLCSCPEYFHGSEKSHKKKTTCKKCKGIRVPLKPIGGTVRVLSTPCHPETAIYRNFFATVRLPSKSDFERQRPTILCEEYDPYNFLRYSRLLYTVKFLLLH